MSAPGWDWPDQTGPRSYACLSVAEDRRTGKQYKCQLRVGHSDVCHWQRVEGKRLHSLSWIRDGLITFVGEAGT